MKPAAFQTLPQERTAPTHANITHFLSTLLPHCTNDVKFRYHTPRHFSYDPVRAPVSHVVLSVTPTPGVYAALNSPNFTDPPLCVIHRPWQLNRHAVRRDALIIASHKSLDTYLTVGWNTALASRLCLRTESAMCIQGYKGDPLRKIGLVAPLRPGIDCSLGHLNDSIRREFAGAGDLYIPVGSDTESRLTTVAIMNAFHPEEVKRVLDAAAESGWIKDHEQGHQVLYLTGAARDSGLEAAYIAGMPVVCVGHRSCEEWGIRYLAAKVKERWPDLTVDEIFEDEEGRPCSGHAKDTIEGAAE